VPDPIILVGFKYPFKTSSQLTLVAPSDVELGNTTDPYANHLDVSIAWVLEVPAVNKFNIFICKAVVDSLIAGVTALAPELAEVDIFEGIQLESRCNDAH
jgi:hypothetical protein